MKKKSYRQKWCSKNSSWLNVSGVCIITDYKTSRVIDLYYTSVLLIDV